MREILLKKEKIIVKYLLAIILTAAVVHSSEAMFFTSLSKKYGKSHELPITIDMTIGDAKRLLGDKLGIDASRIKLLTAGHVFPDNKTFEDIEDEEDIKFKELQSNAHFSIADKTQGTATPKKKKAIEQKK